MGSLSFPRVLWRGRNPWEKGTPPCGSALGWRRECGGLDERWAGASSVFSPGPSHSSLPVWAKATGLLTGCRVLGAEPVERKNSYEALTKCGENVLGQQTNAASSWLNAPGSPTSTALRLASLNGLLLNPDPKSFQK